MNDNYIRNREGKIVGRYDGHILRDGTGRIVAKVDADGYTRERSGRIVGRGDLRLLQLGKIQHDK
jgi:hypothetical protein